MKRFNYISKYKHLTGICFGIIAALAILVSQSFYYDVLASAEKMATEVAGENDHGEAHDILTISKDAVTSAAQLIIDHSLHFISDIYLNDKSEVTIEPNRKIDANTYFKTLFRLIISPNAP